MAKFAYNVQDAQGSVSKGFIDAPDEEQAVLALQNRGLFILSIKAEHRNTGFNVFFSVKKMGGEKVKGRELAFFGEQMATLLAGGVPLVRSLSLLAEHTQNKNFGFILSDITKEVSAGGALHKAMEKHPRVFGSIWVSLVQAGEMGGQLPGVLRQIANYVESQESIKSKIITALAYPAVLMTISVGVLIYFIVYIVPVFATIFKDFDLKLPALTAFIVSFSMIISNYFMFMIIGGVGIVLAFRAYVSTTAGRLTWNRVQFSFPSIGDFIKNILLERLLTTMATLIKSGVSILNTITVLEGAFTSNLLIQNALKSVKNEVASGKSISESFKKTAIFPSLVTEMMWMGEESGKLPEIIGTLSKFYQEQIDQFIRRFSSIIDPILVLGVGGIVAVIVMAVFMPIFQLSQIKG